MASRSRIGRQLAATLCAVLLVMGQFAPVLTLAADSAGRPVETGTVDAPLEGVSGSLGSPSATAPDSSGARARGAPFAPPFEGLTEEERALQVRYAKIVGRQSNQSFVDDAFWNENQFNFPWLVDDSYLSLSVLPDGTFQVDLYKKVRLLTDRNGIRYYDPSAVRDSLEHPAVVSRRYVNDAEVITLFQKGQEWTLQTDGEQALFTYRSATKEDSITVNLATGHILKRVVTANGQTQEKDFTKLDQRIQKKILESKTEHETEHDPLVELRSPFTTSTPFSSVLRNTLPTDRSYLAGIIDQLPQMGSTNPTVVEPAVDEGPLTGDTILLAPLTSTLYLNSLLGSPSPQLSTTTGVSLSYGSTEATAVAVGLELTTVTATEVLRAAIEEPSPAESTDLASSAVLGLGSIVNWYNKTIRPFARPTVDLVTLRDEAGDTILDIDLKGGARFEGLRKPSGVASVEVNARLGDVTLKSTASYQTNGQVGVSVGVSVGTPGPHSPGATPVADTTTRPSERTRVALQTFEEQLRVQQAARRATEDQSSLTSLGNAVTTSIIRSVADVLNNTSKRPLGPLDADTQDLKRRASGPSSKLTDAKSLAAAGDRIDAVNGAIPDSSSARNPAPTLRDRVNSGAGWILEKVVAAATLLGPILNPNRAAITEGVREPKKFIGDTESAPERPTTSAQSGPPVVTSLVRDAAARLAPNPPPPVWPANAVKWVRGQGFFNSQGNKIERAGSEYPPYFYQDWLAQVWLSPSRDALYYYSDEGTSPSRLVTTLTSASFSIIPTDLGSGLSGGAKELTEASKSTAFHDPTIEPLIAASAVLTLLAGSYLAPQARTDSMLTNLRDSLTARDVQRPSPPTSSGERPAQSVAALDTSSRPRGFLDWLFGSDPSTRVQVVEMPGQRTFTTPAPTTLSEPEIALRTPVAQELIDGQLRPSTEPRPTDFRAQGQEPAPTAEVPTRPHLSLGRKVWNWFTTGSPTGEPAVAPTTGALGRITSPTVFDGAPLGSDGAAEPSVTPGTRRGLLGQIWDRITDKQGRDLAAQRTATPSPPPASVEPNTSVARLIPVKPKSQPTGAFLSPPDPNYQRSVPSEENLRFQARMAEAIADAEQAFRQGSSGRAAMNGLAAVRRAVALEANPNNRLYGLPLPETEAEIDTYRRESGTTKKYTTLQNITLADKIQSTGRFSSQYEAALAIAKENTVWERPRIRIGDRSYGLTVFLVEFEKGLSGEVGNKFVLALHPDAKESVAIRTEAFRLLEEARTERTLGETIRLNKLAEAYRLFMHATPYANGTPSIVESTFDAILRAEFGRTFPLKSAEPFWDALMAPADQPYTWDRLMRNFQDPAAPSQPASPLGEPETIPLNDAEGTIPATAKTEQRALPIDRQVVELEESRLFRNRVDYEPTTLAEHVARLNRAVGTLEDSGKRAVKKGSTLYLGGEPVTAEEIGTRFLEPARVQLELADAALKASKPPSILRDPLGFIRWIFTPKAEPSTLADPLPLGPTPDDLATQAKAKAESRLGTALAALDQYTRGEPLVVGQPLQEGVGDLLIKRATSALNQAERAGVAEVRVVTVEGNQTGERTIKLGQAVTEINDARAELARGADAGTPRQPAPPSNPTEAPTKPTSAPQSEKPTGRAVSLQEQALVAKYLARGMSAQDAALAAAADYRVKQDYASLKTQYLAQNTVPESGRVTLNLDNVLPLFDGYRGSNQQLFITAASNFQDKVLKDVFKSQQGIEGRRVLLTAAGPGSGKSTLAAGDLGYHLVIDSVVSDPKKAADLIKQLQKNGYTVDIDFVDTAPVEAAIRVATRAVELAESGAPPRTLPVNGFVQDQNLKARQTIIGLLEQVARGDLNGVTVRLFDNNGPPERANEPITGPPDKLLQDLKQRQTRYTERTSTQMIEETRHGIIERLGSKLTDGTLTADVAGGLGLGDPARGGLESVPGTEGRDPAPKTDRPQATDRTVPITGNEAAHPTRGMPADTTTRGSLGTVAEPVSSGDVATVEKPATTPNRLAAFLEDVTRRFTVPPAERPPVVCPGRTCAPAAETAGTGNDLLKQTPAAAETKTQVVKNDQGKRIVFGEEAPPVTPSAQANSLVEPKGDRFRLVAGTDGAPRFERVTTPAETLPRLTPAEARELAKLAESTRAALAEPTTTTPTGRQSLQNRLALEIPSTTPKPTSTPASSAAAQRAVAVAVEAEGGRLIEMVRHEDGSFRSRVLSPASERLGGIPADGQLYPPNTPVAQALNRDGVSHIQVNLDTQTVTIDRPATDRPAEVVKLAAPSTATPPAPQPTPTTATVEVKNLRVGETVTVETGRTSAATGEPVRYRFRVDTVTDAGATVSVVTSTNRALPEGTTATIPADATISQGQGFTVRNEQGTQVNVGAPKTVQRSEAPRTVTSGESPALTVTTKPSGKETSVATGQASRPTQAVAPIRVTTIAPPIKVSPTQGLSTIQGQGFDVAFPELDAVDRVTSSAGRFLGEQAKGLTIFAPLIAADLINFSIAGETNPETGKAVTLGEKLGHDALGLGAFVAGTTAINVAAEVGASSLFASGVVPAAFAASIPAATALVVEAVGLPLAAVGAAYTGGRTGQIVATLQYSPGDLYDTQGNLLVGTAKPIVRMEGSTYAVVKDGVAYYLNDVGQIKGTARPLDANIPSGVTSIFFSADGQARVRDHTYPTLASVASSIQQPLTGVAADFKLELQTAKEAEAQFLARKNATRGTPIRNSLGQIIGYEEGTTGLAAGAGLGLGSGVTEPDGASISGSELTHPDRPVAGGTNTVGGTLVWNSKRNQYDFVPESAAQVALKPTGIQLAFTGSESVSDRGNSRTVPAALASDAIMVTQPTKTATWVDFSQLAQLLVSPGATGTLTGQYGVVGTTTGGILMKDTLTADELARSGIPVAGLGAQDSLKLRPENGYVTLQRLTEATTQMNVYDPATATRNAQAITETAIYQVKADGTLTDHPVLVYRDGKASDIDGPALAHYNATKNLKDVAATLKELDLRDIVEQARLNDLVARQNASVGATGTITAGFDANGTPIFVRVGEPVKPELVADLIASTRAQNTVPGSIVLPVTSVNLPVTRDGNTARHTVEAPSLNEFLGAVRQQNLIGAAVSPGELVGRNLAEGNAGQAAILVDLAKRENLAIAANGASSTYTAGGNLTSGGLTNRDPLAANLGGAPKGYGFAEPPKEKPATAGSETAGSTPVPSDQLFQGQKCAPGGTLGTGEFCINGVLFQNGPNGVAFGLGPQGAPTGGSSTTTSTGTVAYTPPVVVRPDCRSAIGTNLCAPGTETKSIAEITAIQTGAAGYNSQLTVSPTTIKSGQSATLSWKTTAPLGSIDRGIGDVATSGSGLTKTVSPAQTTTYTFRAQDSARNTLETATATVYVNEPVPVTPPLSQPVGQRCTTTRTDEPRRPRFASLSFVGVAQAAQSFNGYTPPAGGFNGGPAFGTGPNGITITPGGFNGGPPLPGQSPTNSGGGGATKPADPKASSSCPPVATPSPTLTHGEQDALDQAERNRRGAAEAAARAAFLADCTAKGGDILKKDGVDRCDTGRTEREGLVKASGIAFYNSIGQNGNCIVLGVGCPAEPKAPTATVSGRVTQTWPGVTEPAAGAGLIVRAINGLTDATLAAAVGKPLTLLGTVSYLPDPPNQVGVSGGPTRLLTASHLSAGQDERLADQWTDRSQGCRTKLIKQSGGNIDVNDPSLGCFAPDIAVGTLHRSADGPPQLPAEAKECTPVVTIPGFGSFGGNCTTKPEYKALEARLNQLTAQRAQAEQIRQLSQIYGGSSNEFAVPDPAPYYLISTVPGIFGLPTVQLVWVKPSGETEAETRATADTDGKFTLDGLTASASSIRLSEPGRTEALATLPVTALPTKPQIDVRLAAQFTTPAPKPTVTLRAEPAAITAGQTATLTTTVERATSAHLDHNLGPAAAGWLATTGSVSVTPAETTTYRLTARGPGGETTTTATVTVTPKPATTAPPNASATPPAPSTQPVSAPPATRPPLPNTAITKDGYTVHRPSGAAPLTVTVDFPADATATNSNYRTVDWGDGTRAEPLGAWEGDIEVSFLNNTKAGTVTHVYRTAGTYPLTLHRSSTDTAGTRLTIVNVSSEPASSLIHANGYTLHGVSGAAPQSVVLDYPAIPKSEWITIFWGDGQSQRVSAPYIVAGPAASLTHTYPVAGRYLVSVSSGNVPLVGCQRSGSSYAGVTTCDSARNGSPIGTVTVSDQPIAFSEPAASATRPATGNQLIAPPVRSPLATDKPSYASGETVTVTFTNPEPTEIVVTEAGSIGGCFGTIGIEQAGKTVLPRPGVCPMYVVARKVLKPGESITEPWVKPQVALSGSAVAAPAGQYRAVFTYAKTLSGSVKPSDRVTVTADFVIRGDSTSTLSAPPSTEVRTHPSGGAVAGYTVQPSSGQPPLTVRLDYPATPSTPTALLTNKQIDWGDGVKENIGQSRFLTDFYSAGSMDHRYVVSGTYTVQLVETSKIVCLSLDCKPTQTTKSLGTVTVGSGLGGLDRLPPVSTPPASTLPPDTAPSADQQTTVTLTTDKSSYAPSETITATLRNSSAETITVRGGSGFCGGPLIWEDRQGKRVDQRNRACPDVVIPNRDIGPGESVTERWDQQHLTADGGLGPATPGPYRVAWYRITRVHKESLADQAKPIPITADFVIAPVSDQPAAPPAPTPVSSGITVSTNKATYQVGEPVALTLRNQGATDLRYQVTIGGEVVWGDFIVKAGQTVTDLVWDQQLKGTAAAPGQYPIAVRAFIPQVSDGQGSFTFPVSQAILGQTSITITPATPTSGTPATPPTTPPSATPKTYRASGTYTSPSIAIDPTRTLTRLEVIGERLPKGTSLAYQVATNTSNFNTWQDLPAPVRGDTVTIDLTGVASLKTVTSVKLRIKLSTDDPVATPSLRGFRFASSPKAIPLPASTTVTLTTDKPTYRPGETVTATVRNGTAAPISFFGRAEAAIGGCHSSAFKVALEGKQLSARPGGAGSSTLPLCTDDVPTTTIKAGETITAATWQQQVFDTQASTPAPAPSGVYELRFTYTDASGEHTATASFTIGQ